MRFYLIVALALSLAGCSSLVAYTPKLMGSDLDASKTIRRVLLEQPGNHAAHHVDINDEAITINGIYSAVNKSALAVGAIVRSSHGRTVTLYYQSIGAVDLYKRKGWHIVIIRDKFNNQKYKVVTNRVDAKLFIDALSHLRKSFS